MGGSKLDLNAHLSFISYAYFMFYGKFMFYLLSVYVLQCKFISTSKIKCTVYVILEDDEFFSLYIFKHDRTLKI